MWSKRTVSRVLFPAAVTHRRVTIIPLGPPLPTASSSLTRGFRTGRPQAPPYLALLRMGFTELSASPPTLVSSYLTLSPLPDCAEAHTGGLLSVALSLGSPPVPVKDHPALRSPDFPPPAFAQGSSGQRSSGCLQPRQLMNISVRRRNVKQPVTMRTGLNFINSEQAVEHLRRQVHVTA